MCERLLSYSSPLELYAEELEASSGRHLGNYPQAFTHLALINAVTHVIAAQQAGLRRASDQQHLQVIRASPEQDHGRRLARARGRAGVVVLARSWTLALLTCAHALTLAVGSLSVSYTHLR